MISASANPLLLPHCSYVSCRFEVEDFDEAIASTIGLELPSAMARAVPKRKAEYLAGRWCAREALRAFSAGPPPNVATGGNREPLWPEDIVGSITHSKGFAAAAVAPKGVLRGIGIDSEQLIQDKTARNVSNHILVAGEAFEENTAQFDCFEAYLTMVFSAKESIFKCLYPHVAKFFEFAAAQIQLDANNHGTFHYTLLKDLNSEFCRGYRGEGVFIRDGDFFHTAVLLAP